MRLQKQIDRLISQQASEWIEVLKDGGVKERTAFVAWLKESRRNVEEFLAMVAVDRELQHIDPMRRHDLQALAEKISPTGRPIAALRPTPARMASRLTTGWSWPRVFGVAAALLVISALLVRGISPFWQAYSTAIGEQRAIQLPDGSVVHLNTQSEIEVRLGSTSRDIRLVRGEALFKVAHDARRTFWVRTPGTAIRALGTEFNVYTDPQGTTVSVLEGKVQVSSSATAPPLAAALGAGEEARVGEGGRVQRHALEDAGKVTAWRERRLVFRDDTLEDMVAQFNRYNRLPRFRLEGEAIKRRHYSGTFDADDPASLAALLSHERGVVVENRDANIVVRARQ